VATWKTHQFGRGTFMTPRFSIKLRIYSIIGLSFCGLIGLAAVQVDNLASSLREQRQNELSHLAETALSIVRTNMMDRSATIPPPSLPRSGPRRESGSCATATAIISGSTI
jgi:hypothetical protein